MPLSPESAERLKKVAKFAVVPVLGALTAKSIYERGQTEHVSYWEASQSLFIDLIHDGQKKVIRLSGVVRHGVTRDEVLDIELDDREYTSLEIDELEGVFLPPDLSAE